MLGLIFILLATLAIQLSPLAKDISGESGSIFGFIYAFTGLIVSTFLIAVISLKAAFVTIVLLALVGAWKGFQRKIPAQCLRALGNYRKRLAQFRLLVLFAIGTIGCIQFLTLISALAPITSWDATVAHIALPADYWKLGDVRLITGNVYSGYPQYLHALYAVLYGFSGESGPALLSWAMGPLGCFVVYAIGKKLGDEETGYIAAAIFAAAPIVAQQAGTVSIDLAFTVMTLGVWLFWLQALEDKTKIRYLYMAALIAGVSCGIRHTGFIVCAFMALITCIEFRNQLKPCLLVCVLMAGGALSSLLYTWINTGNPFYPLLSEWFAAPDLPDIQDTRIGAHETVRNSSRLEFLLYPWHIVMQPGKYDGWSASPGGLGLILGLPGIYLGAKSAKYIGAFSLLPVWFFYFFQRLARYVFPFLAPLLALAALTYTSLPKYRKPLSVLIALHLLTGVIIAAGGMYFKIPVAFGIESDEDYLTQRVERFEAFQWVNDELSDEFAIMTFDLRSSYIHQPTFPNLEVLFTLGEMEKEELMGWFKERNIKYIFYPEAYVTEAPVFAARGLDQLLESWRQDSDHFAIIHSMEIERPRAGGTEIVEIWEVAWDQGDARVRP
jgi:4-amino-4-deoxy-L-arabinose transferase-like glycosyltransferase